MFKFDHEKKCWKLIPGGIYSYLQIITELHYQSVSFMTFIIMGSVGCLTTL
jgi:hypothetical protein